MSSSVDNRIVEMEFDNQQFESGVATTMDTLKKFKEALSFDGATKGLESVEQAANGFDMSHLGDSVDSIADKFTTLGLMGVTALQNITNKAIDAGVDLVKSLTIDNVTAGMDKYERSLKATQTIMAATGKEVDEVQYYMDKLNWYTDETSYNYSDMADNIARFTSNGVDLDTATTAMFGVANASALAGTDIQTAGHAMEGFAKALGQGYMDQKSWQWIRTAKMDTMETKQAFIEAAIEAGTLERAADGAVYAVENGELVTAENFTAQLGKAKWLTSEAMVNALSRFGSASEEIFKIYEEKGWTASEILAHIDELGLELDETSLKAFKAAQEYRTFSDAIDATKDAVSTGWMQTFRYLFGNYEEAKTLWTALGDTLYDIFAEGGNARNELLAQWSELKGREVFVEALANIGSSLYYYDEELERHMGVFGVIKDTFSDMFPSITAERLFDITEGFRNFTASLVPSEKTLNSISNIVAGILAPIRLILTIGKGIIYAISPLFRIVGDLLGLTIDFTGGIGALSKNFFGLIEAFIEGSGIFKIVHNILNTIIDVIEGIVGGIWNIITGTNIFKDVWAFIVDKFDKAKAFFGNLKLFKDIGDGVTSFSDKIKEAADNFVDFIDKSGAIQAFSDGIRSAWHKIKDFFNSLDILGKVERGWARLTAWFVDAKTAVSDFFQNSIVIKLITETFTQLWEAIKKINLITVLKGLVAPFWAVWQVIKLFGSAISSFVQTSEEFETVRRIFDVVRTAFGNFGSTILNIVSPAIDAIKDKFTNIHSKLKNLHSLIQEFGLKSVVTAYLIRGRIELTRIWKNIKEFAETHPILKGVIDRIEQMKTSFGGVYNIIKSHLSPIFGGITKRFGSFGGYLQHLNLLIKEFGLKSVVKTYLTLARAELGKIGKEIKEFAESDPFLKGIVDKVEVLGGFLGRVGTAIASISTPILQKIEDAFSGIGKNVDEFFTLVSEVGLKEAIDTYLPLAKAKLEEIWDRVKSFIDAHPTLKAIVDNVESLWEFLKGVGEAISEFSAPILQKIEDKFGGIGDSVGRFFGLVKEFGLGAAIRTYLILARIELRKIWENVQEFINAHPTLKAIVDDIGTLWSFLKDVGAAISDLVSPSIDKIKKKITSLKGNVSQFFSLIKEFGLKATIRTYLTLARIELRKIGNNLKNLITNTKTFKKVNEFISPIVQHIKDVVHEQGPLKGIVTLFGEFGGSVKTYAQNLWKNFKSMNIVDTVKKKFQGFGKSVDDFFQSVREKGLYQTLKDTFANVKQNIIDSWTSLKDFIKSTKAYKKVKDFLQPAIDKFKELDEKYHIMDTIGDVFTTVGDKITKFGDRIYNFLKEHGVIDFFEEHIPIWVDKIGEFALKVYDFVAPYLEKAGKKIGEFLDSLRDFKFSDITDFFKNLFPKKEDSDEAEESLSFFERIQKFFKPVTDFFKGLFGKKDGEEGPSIFEIIQEKVGGFVDWIKKHNVIGIILGILGVLAIVKIISIASGIASFVDVLNNLTKPRLGKFLLQVATSIAILAGSMYLLGNVKDLKGAEDALVLIAGILGAFVVIGVALDKVSFFSKKKGAFKQLGSGLLQVAIAIGVMVFVIDLIAKSDINIQLIQDNIEKFKIVFGALGIVILLSRAAGQNADKAGSYLLKLAIAMGIIVGVIWLAGKMDPKTIERGGIVVAAIAGFMAIFMLLAKLPGGKNAEIIGKMFLKVAVALAIIVGVMWLVGHMSDDTLAKGTLFVGGIMAFMAIFMLLAKLPGGSAANDIGKMFLKVSIAIGIIVALIWVISKMDESALLKGVIVVGAIMAFMAIFMLLAKLPGSIDGVGKNMILLGIAIGIIVGVMAYALYQLNGLDIGALIVDAIVLAALAFALRGVVLGFGKKLSEADIPSAIAGVLLVGVLLFELVAALNYMPKDTLGNITNAAALIILAVILGSVVTTFSKLNINVRSALSGVVGVGALLAALVIGLRFMPTDSGANLQNAIALAVLGGVLGTVVAVFAKLGVGVAQAIAAGFSAAAGIGTFLVTLGAIIEFLGWAAGEQTNLDKGIEVCKKIGQAIGEFIGGIIGGIVGGTIEGIGNALPGFGENLQKFGESVKPFMDACAGFSEASLNGVKNLAEAIIVITAAEIINAVGDWISSRLGGDGLVGFGEKLKEFAGPFSEFVTTIGNAGTESAVNAATAAANALGAFVSIVPKEGGLLQAIVGETMDIGEFGKQLEAFAGPFASFCNTMAGIDTLDGAKAATDVAATVLEFAKETPKTGGLIQKITGEYDLKKFGESLKDFATPFAEFCNKMSGISTLSGAEAATKVASVVTAFANETPKFGGLIQKITGEYDLAKFGGQLQAFAPYFASYCTTMSGVTNFQGVKDATNLASFITEFANATPKEGGLLSKIFGGNINLSSFGQQLSEFSTGFKTYYDNMSGITWSTVESAVKTTNDVIDAMDKLDDIYIDPNGNNPMMTAIGMICDIPNQLASSVNTENTQTAITAITSLINTVVGQFDSSNVSVENKLTMSSFGKLICERIQSGLQTYSYLVFDKLKWLCDDLTGIIFWMKTYLPEDTFYTTIAKEIIVDKLAAGMNDNITIVTTAAEGLANAIIEGINGILTTDAMNSIGLNAAKGLAAGMTSKEATAAIEAASKSSANTAINTTNKTFDENSPSKVFYQIGEYAMMGLANGITQSTYMVANASDRSAQKTIDGYNYLAQLIAASLDENLDANPVITPVLDLSNIMAGTQTMNTLLANSKVAMVAGSLQSSEDLTSSIAKAVTDGLKSVQNTNTDNVGGITVNVYGSQGQDVDALADAVAARISSVVQRRKAVYA